MPTKTRISQPPAVGALDFLSLSQITKLHVLPVDSLDSVAAQVGVYWEAFALSSQEVVIE
jgi:hypothetical protein